MQVSPPYLIIISRFMLEGAVEIGLSAIISLLMLQKECFDSNWEIVSFLFAIVSLVTLVICPFYYAKLIKRYLEEAKIAGDPAESDLHGLFGAFRLNRVALWYPNIFFLRRYLMILILTLLHQVKNV